MSSLGCKVFMNNETHPYLNLWVSTNIPLKQLRGIVERATAKFHLGAIRYLDDEGDKITIETDIELAEAIKLAQKTRSSLQLYVEPTSQPAAPVDVPPPVVPAPVVPEIKVPEKAPVQETKPVTHRAVCDSCNKHIVGIRYKCVNCPDYDLCEVCEEANGATGSIHQADHVFLKIRRPICPFQRISIPNLYEGAQRRHGQCPVVVRSHVAVRGKPCTVAVSQPQQAQPQANNLSEDRFAALEAKVAQLAQEMQQITAKNQKELADKQQREERKKAQEQKRKEVRALLQKAGEERRAIKKEQKLKKDQQREAARQAAAASLAAKRAAAQEAAAQEASTIVVKVEEPKVEEEAAHAHVPEVIVQVEEPKVEEESSEEKKDQVEVVVKIEEEEAENESEEKKEGDDFVVINQEAPSSHDERALFWKDSLEILASMGFTNIERNLELLARHSGDIQAVITVLLDIVEVL